MDFRKLRYRLESGEFKIITVDTFIYQLLRDAVACGVDLPVLPKRYQLEAAGRLPGPYRSILDEEQELSIL